MNEQIVHGRFLLKNRGMTLQQIENAVCALKLTAHTLPRLHSSTKKILQRSSAQSDNHAHDGPAEKTEQIHSKQASIIHQAVRNAATKQDRQAPVYIQSLTTRNKENTNLNKVYKPEDVKQQIEAIQTKPPKKTTKEKRERNWRLRRTVLETSVTSESSDDDNDIAWWQKAEESKETSNNSSRNDSNTSVLADLEGLSLQELEKQQQVLQAQVSDSFKFEGDISLDVSYGDSFNQELITMDNIQDKGRAIHG